MNIMLDTDVLIDCMRGTSQAQEWLLGSSSLPFQVPGIVAMELAAGCRNLSEMKRTLRFLTRFDVVWPEAAEFAQGFKLITEYGLKSGLGIPDCLIAAMTLSRSSILYTFNYRHFRCIPGLNVRKPYSR